MTTFTESHLRRMILASKDREVGLYLASGAVVRGIVVDIDRDQDGFIEFSLKSSTDVVRFVTPVENIVAYEVSGS